MILALQAAAEDPVIVRVVEAPGDALGLRGVFLSSLGLTAVVLLLAIVLGVGVALVLFRVRARENRS